MALASPSEPGEPQSVPVKDSVIPASHLTKMFGDDFAVQDISFDLPRASIFGFIGPSGSGKTTTVRLLTGVYTPTAGDVRVLDRDPANFSQGERAHLQPNSVIASQDIEQYVQSVGSQLVNAEATVNVDEALNRLRLGQVDMVIVEPADALNTIKNNRQVVFTLYHQEIDPVRVTYVTYLGWLHVGAVNQQVLRGFAMQGQKDAVNLRASLQEARKDLSAMRQAVGHLPLSAKDSRAAE